MCLTRTLHLKIGSIAEPYLSVPAIIVKLSMYLKMLTGPIDFAPRFGIK